MISKEFKDYLEIGFQNIYESIQWDKSPTYNIRGYNERAKKINDRV